ncbi:MAG: hypothetical protein KAJ10_03585 [Thermodesulfovibrionia bacterium]|nr:hypothetical protein [Thermodesulfovibrionia bacterium]
MSSYSVLGIWNLALGGIGQSKIASLTEQSVPAQQAEIAWPFVRDEVLESADWTFAKTRKALAQNSTDPVQGFSFAYTLPADFLRLCRQRKEDPSVYPDATTGSSYSYSFFVEGRPVAFRYVIEALADGTLCLFTDYDNSSVDLIIQYIRREQNPALYSAHFCTTAAFRLGAALAPVLTESSSKEERQWSLYNNAIKRAKGHNASADYLNNETGNDAWETAGR